MRRPAIFALLAGIAAILAAIIVFSALKRREAEVQQALASTEDIVVAAHDLPLGTKIDASALKTARWARDSVPAGAYTDAQALNGAFVKNEFLTGEPIVANKLFVGEKTSGVMPLLIAPGMRAMAVPVDEVSDIAGFVQPRTRVDVLVAVSGSGHDSPSFSRVVLQNVEVLATAQEIEKKNDEPQVVKVVTLLVTPQQAERLALASHEGQLRLAMRNYSDNKIVATSGVEMHDLYHSEADAPTIRSQPAPAHISRRAGRVAPPLNVEIMRDGKAAESVSFINAGLPAHSARRSGAVAPAAETPPASVLSAPLSSGAGSDKPAASSAIGEIGAIPGAAISGAAGYQPAPKTIAIP